MDAEVKQRNRRRKRAQRMQAQRDVLSKNQAAADSNEDEDESPIREKPPRPPIRRKKSKEPLVEEDIIDGFAVLGFKTYEDLETVLKLANKENVRRLAEVQDRVVPPRVPQLPQLPGSGDLHRPAHHITHHISAHAPHSLTTLSHHDAATSDDSGRASERLTGSSVAPRDADSSRDRLSDASSRCSSGKGYICDSEGEDDKYCDSLPTPGSAVTIAIIVRLADRGDGGGGGEGVVAADTAVGDVVDSHGGGGGNPGPGDGAAATVVAVAPAVLSVKEGRQDNVQTLLISPLDGSTQVLRLEEMNEKKQSQLQGQKGSDASSVIFGLGGLSAVSTTTTCATVTSLSRHTKPQHVGGKSAAVTATTTASSLLGPSLPSVPCNLLSNASGVGSPVPAPTPPPAPSPAPAQGLVLGVGGGGEKMVVADKGATSLTTRLLGPIGMGVPMPSAAIPNIASSDMDTTPIGAAAGGAATATARGLDMAATGAAPPPVTPNSLPSPAPAASVPASTASLPVSSTPMTASGVGVCGGGAIPPNIPSVPNPMHLASASINATAAAATPVTSHPHPPTALNSATSALGGISATHAHHARTDSPAVASIATSAAPSYHPTTTGYHHHHHHHPQQLQQQQHQMPPQLYTPYAPHVTSTSAGYGGIHAGHHMQQHPIHQNHHHPVGLVGGPSQQPQQQMGAIGLTSANVVTIPRSPGAGQCHSPGGAVRERDTYGLPPRSNNAQQLPPTPSPNTPGIQLPPHPSTLSSAVNTAVSSSLLTNTSSKPQQPPPPSSWSGLQPSIIPPVASPAPVGTTINGGAPGSVQNIMGPPPRHHSPASIAPNSTGAVVSTLPNPYSIPSMFPVAVASTTSGSPSIVTAHTPMAGSGGSVVFGANGTSLPPSVPPIPTPPQLQPPTIPPTQPTQPPTVPPPPHPFSAESLFSQSSVSSQPTMPPPPSTSQTQADLLRRELDNRFLASTQDRGAAPPPPPYLRTEMHQHQHHHTHVHQHTTSLMPPGGVAATPGTANLFPAPLFKDIPKMGSVESPFYRQSSLALPGSYGAYGAGLLHPGLTAPAGATPFVAPTHLPAFQPKVRVFNPPVAQETPAKPKLTKSGKWNAMHVRVAWEIYHHQHKGDKPGSGLKADLLRPPTHLFNPSVRAHELGPTQPPSTGAHHQYPPLPGNLAAAAAAAAGHRPPGVVGIPPPGAYDAHHGSLFTSPAGLAAAVAAQHHHQQQQALAAGRTALSPFTRYSAYPPPPGSLPPPPPTTSPYQQHPPYTQQVPPGSIGPGPPPQGPPHRTADLAAALLHDPWRRTYASLPPPVPSGPAGPPSAPWGLKTSVTGSASEALLNLEQQQKVAREREQREREEREERERIRERQRREERERREREEKQRRLEQQQQEQRERDRREKERRDHERRELERERERVERERQLHQQRIAAQQAAAAAAAAAAQAAAIDQKPSLSSLTAAGAVMRDRSPTISMRNGGLVYNHHTSPFPYSPTSFLPGPDDAIRIKEEPRLNSQLPPASNSNITTNHNLNPKQEEEASASLLMRNAAAAAAAAAAIDPRYHPYLRPGPPQPHMSLQPPHLSRVMPPPPHHAYGAPPGTPGVHGWGIAPPDPYFRSDHLRYYNPLMDAAILRAEEERAKLYSAAYGSPLHHPSSIAHAHAQAAAHAHAHAAQLRAKDSAAAAALMHMRGPPGSTGQPLSIASGGPLPPPTSVSSGGIAPANHKIGGTPPNVGVQGQIGVGGPMEMKKEEPR